MIILTVSIIAIMLLVAAIVTASNRDKPTFDHIRTFEVDPAPEFDGEIPESFDNWAYGSKGKGAPNLLKAWNALHGATYPLSPNDISQANLDVMHKLFDQCVKNGQRPSDIGLVIPIKENSLQKHAIIVKTPIKVESKKEVIMKKMEGDKGIKEAKKSIATAMDAKRPVKMKKIGIKAKKVK